MESTINTYQSNKQLFEDKSFEAIAIYDDHQYCVDINPAFTRIFQYSPDEVIGKQPFFLIDTDDLPIVMERLEHEYTSSYELKLVRKDGSKFIGLLQGETVEIGGKKHRITTCRDISDIKKIQRQLERKNDEFHSMFNNSLVGIALVDKHRNIIIANHTGANILGYDCAEQVIGKNLQEFHISQTIANAFTKLYTETILERKIVTSEVQFKKKDGSIIWISASGCLVSQQNPPSLNQGVVWVINDVTRLKQAEIDLNEAYNELEVIFNNALVGILVLKDGRYIHRMNQTFADMIGGTPDKWIGQSTKGFHLGEEAFEEFGKRFYANLTTQEVSEAEFQIKDKSGQSIWVSISGRAIDKNIPSDLNKGVIWVIRDISTRKKMERELIALSRTDDLTQVSNRRFFLESATNKIRVIKQQQTKLSLMMLDIDHFKAINDTKGHFTGDLALQLFAEICKRFVRPPDLLGRLGGEEFALMLPDTCLEEAKIIGERIQCSLAQESNNHDVIPPMTVSIGLIEVSPDENIESALRRTDKMLYQAKDNGRNRIES
ncbi:PAS domain S-box protein [Vibrio sp. RC27]